ncbi:OLC1v1001232C1 [Oldenlandia corymbosa var. corymbosa]|uniref:OLC1v1001232C1 n=1 Tax=Oldenlandia corymbosa var. corymbosa TaxID=529605 RepID=A0AAV1D4U7_OLDCO|nr:OLC1v1001232C1 [Oldenlandia corymbosa var. corymbosa]
MELSVPSSRPVKTLDSRALEAEVAETLEQRQVESTSGLTMKEKELILIDLQPSPERSELVPQSMINPNPPQTGNMSLALQGLDEGDNELPLEKDKSAIATTVSSEILPATVTKNCFAALEMIEEVVNEVVSVDEEEYVEDVYAKNPPTQHELQNDTELDGASQEVLMLENLSPLESGKCSDDGDIGKVSKPVEMEDVNRASGQMVMPTTFM